MSCRIHGLRKQDIEATEGPLDLRRKKEAKKTCLEEGVGKGSACSREKAIRLKILCEYTHLHNEVL